VTTRHDPSGRQTVMDLVPAVSGLFPVGRLDVTTEGLLLLTNDGAFAQRVSHPRYEVPRLYHAKVRGLPDAEALARIQRGVTVDGDRLSADRARILEAGHNSWLELTLHEGKQHEVKRLLDAVGHPVSKLKRVAIGPVTDRGLEPGQFRALTPAEVKGLLAGHGVPVKAMARPRRPAHREPPPAAPPKTPPPAFGPRRGGVGQDRSRSGRSHERRGSAQGRRPARPSRSR
jgi:23S rRNA pseudouridine2605 synthase